MERLLIVLLLVIALPGPWWMSLVTRNVDWPIRAKQVLALVLVGLFTGLLLWILISKMRGDRSLVMGLKLLVLIYFIIGLNTAYNSWPRKEKKTERLNDIRDMLESTIEDTERRLRLAAVERLEQLNPRTGIYSHHFVLYTDGAWLEWLNPTNEDGTPDFSVYAVYSNNQAMVNLLAKALPSSCNVERTDRPLWKYPP